MVALMSDSYQTPKLLEDMRFIYENPQSEWLAEAVGLEKTLREMYRDHPAEFLERLDRFEREHARAATNHEKRRQMELARQAREPKEEVKEDVDEGSARAIALCEEFLHRLKLKSEGKE
jgi:hypothetical protein